MYLSPMHVSMMKESEGKEERLLLLYGGILGEGWVSQNIMFFFSLSFYYGITLKANSFNVKFAQFTLSRLYLTPPICSEDRVV